MNIDTALNYVLYFFFYSNIGWLFESLYCALGPVKWENGRLVGRPKWVNRGFLTGPICPIYGTGAVVLDLFLGPVRDKWYLVFFLGMILCDIVEYIAGVLLNKLFHARWWDYSNKLLNIQGYICLKNTIIWGFASLIIVRHIHPFFKAGFDTIPVLYRNIILCIILVVFAIDLINAIIAASDIRKFNKKLYAFVGIFTGMAGNVKNGMESATTAVQQSLLNQGKRIAVWTGDMNAQLEDIKAQFNDIKNGSGTKRSKTARMFRASKTLLNAPLSAFGSIEELLGELKKRITDEDDEML